MIKKEKLDFWIKTNQNVLFSGKAGVGKSTMIMEAFNRAGLNYLYFSGATMDPFVDFCGVPLKTKDEHGNDCIELIMPKHIRPEEIEALFFDEYNRTSKKVISATMELIQFKSINGKKFPKLKIVWAAINPESKDEDEEDDQLYSVETLDPAQKDRFQVHVEIPYECDYNYFSNKFGKEMAQAAIEWWKTLDKKQKNKVSPRRLDYALDFYNQGGELKDVLPKETNITMLSQTLSQGTFETQLDNIIVSKDIEKLRKFISNISNRDIIEKIILKNIKKFGKETIPNMAPEQISSFMIHNIDNENIKSIIVDDINSNGEKSYIFNPIKEIMVSKDNKVSKKLKPFLEKIENKEIKELLEKKKNNKNLEEQLKVGNASWESANKKRSFINEMSTFDFKTLDFNELVKVLKALENTCIHSHDRTIESATGFDPMVKKLIKEMSVKFKKESPKKDFVEDWIKKTPNMASWGIKRFYNADFFENIVKEECVTA